MKPNWPTKKLGEVILNIGDGGTPSTKVPEYFNGEIPWVNIEDIQRNIFDTKRKLSKTGLENSSAKLWPKNIVIFSFGASIGNVGIAKTELCTKQGIAGIVPDESEILTEFLYYTLLKEAKRIKEFGQGMGTTIKEVRPSKLLNFVTFLLPPLPTQQKIVFVLDSIQGAVGVQEKIIEKTKELKKAMMKKLFTEGTRGEKLKETEIGRMPKSWEVVKLEELLDFKNGINFKKEQKGQTGTLTLDVLNMYTDSIYPDLNNLYRVSGDLSDEYLLQQGDILFVRSSLKREGVAWTSLFQGDSEPIFYCGFIIRGRLRNRKLDPKYLVYLLRTEKMRNTMIYSSGSVTITNINQDILSNLKIPLPPLPEQREIAGTLQTLDQKIEIEQKKKALYEELFRTMLNNLMNQEINIDKLKL